MVDLGKNVFHVSSNFQRINQSINQSIESTEQIQHNQYKRYEMDQAESYHRIELNEPAIPFSSKEGRRLFMESIQNGTMECYFPLSEQFITQTHPTFCGIASLTMVLTRSMSSAGRFLAALSY